MKRAFIITVTLAVFSLAATSLAAQEKTLSKEEQKELKKEQKELKKQQKQAEKEMKKKISKASSVIAFEKAAQCIRSGNFVIEASRIQSQKGGITNVSSITNFLSVSNGESVIQIAPSKHISGPNGVGGITLDGTVSNVEIKSGKDGSLTYSYSVQGIGISATVKVQLPKGSGEASASVYPNFSSHDVILHGKVVSPQNSRVFKGRAL